ncbi:MAG: bifunctional [glutamine synthetase] adenylyltransferase/[glutamine synthetase]-adenylyl-L-tyrosine phosphorylase [Dermabacter sp.]|nr:bifunctional [glutamine synthetase] adenylyltransferase/[glutamine synthetase]-adenylyl-L-tyrosine phosphorylase [Dermabacter sp.]
MALETRIIRALQDDGQQAAFGHSELARLGFVHTERSARFLSDDALAFLTPATVRSMGTAADPDEAMIALLRLVEAADAAGVGGAVREAASDEERGPRLVHLLGTSVALGDFLTRHPERSAHILRSPVDLEAPAPDFRAPLLEAVGADPAAEIPVAAHPTEHRDALRVHYYDALCRIAIADIMAADPAAVQPAVSRALSALAAAALDAALALARAGLEDHERVRLAVIAMGKTGAGELNYISDVDVMYVAEPSDPSVSADEVARLGSALARDLARICSERTSEGALWQVDANLRPEGKDGELVRTIDSYRRYYRTWAHSWEFQALLKARAVAGDAALGAEFAALTEPLVWQASTREGFVEDTRAMRRRVVELIPKSEAERNLKLGPGGLRDVEFTIQLLQMVHGRGDETLRVRSTLEALGRLTDGGYVSRDQSAELDLAYRRMRALEHRIQLHRLRRSQVIPSAPADQRRLARSMREAPDAFLAGIDRTRRRVRQLHEEIYYRPLLATSARLSDGEITLSPESQRARLAAIGYRDPAKATQHIAALTQGLSRRSAIQRQLLPSLLEWFADGTDPDLGLLAFRRLSDTLGSTHWYLGLLRDSGVAAKRLTRILSSSRYVGEQLERFPQAVRWLARDADLRPVSREALGAELQAVAARSTREEATIEAIREIRRREITRIALAHLTGALTPAAVAAALTSLADVILTAALASARRGVSAELGLDDLGVDIAIIALGSFGAEEMGYSSDADVQFVAADAGAGSHTLERATAVATALQRILNAPSSGIDMKVNADLRPEGRSGPLVRTLQSWSDYYATHAESWEKQALVRGRIAVGPPELTATLTERLDRVRYPADGLSATRMRDLARMKARIEGERLPRGAKATRHLKLGRGAMTDVEWVVQKLLIAHAHAHPSLRVSGTLTAIDRLADLDLLSARDAQDLAAAWSLAWSLRRALFLWRGREQDVLPTDHVDLRAIAALVDGPSASAREIEERYLKVTRHARAITEREIFGE